jgi:hypothetical protein
VTTTKTRRPGKPGYYASDLVDVLRGEWWDDAEPDARAKWLAGRWRIRMMSMAADMVSIESVGWRSVEPSVSARYRAQWVNGVADDLAETIVLLRRAAELMSG